MSKKTINPVTNEEFIAVTLKEGTVQDVTPLEMLKAVGRNPSKIQWADVFTELSINTTYRPDMGYGRIIRNDESKHIFIFYVYAKEILVCVPNKRREEFLEMAPDWVTEDRWVEHKNWSPNPFWLHCTPKEFLELLAI